MLHLLHLHSSADVVLFDSIHVCSTNWPVETVEFYDCGPIQFNQAIISHVRTASVQASVPIYMAGAFTTKTMILLFY